MEREREVERERGGERERERETERERESEVERERETSKRSHEAQLQLYPREAPPSNRGSAGASYLARVGFMV